MEGIGKFPVDIDKNEFRTYTFWVLTFCGVKSHCLTWKICFIDNYKHDILFLILEDKNNRNHFFSKIIDKKCLN